MRSTFKSIFKTTFPSLVSAYHGWKLKDIYGRYKKKKTEYGFWLWGNDQILSGNFENEETLLLFDLFKESEVFIDIGANIGYYSCIARFQNNYVVSIEPLKENLDYLYSNFVLNNWTDIEVFPLGLSDTPGIKTLYGGSTSASLVKRWAGASELLKRTIPLSTLDIVLGDRFIDKSCVIKIDVEGAEYDLLLGAEKTLSRGKPPVWLVEICLTENQPSGINLNFKNTFELFWKNGYTAMVADSTFRVVSKDDVDRWIKNKTQDFGYINYIFKKD